MNKNIKKLFSTIIMLALITGCFAAMPLAANAAGQTIYLKGTGSDFDEQWQNIFYVGDADTASDPNVWHLVYTDKKNINDVTEMQITFTNGHTFKWIPDMGFSTNNAGNNPGWVIVAPCDWEIYIGQDNNNESGSYVVTEGSGNPQFNISGFHKGSDPDQPHNDVMALAKYVEGEIITEWLSKSKYSQKEQDDIVKGMVFSLYAAEGKNIRVERSGALMALGNLNPDGSITFDVADVRTLRGDNTIRGWYAVFETFKEDSLAEQIFEAVEPLYIYFDGANIIGPVIEFDYEALYTINYAYSTERNLGYDRDVLNNGGEFFYIGVINTNTNKEYPSYCANAGSKNFAGDYLDCAGYLCAESFEKLERTNEATYGEFIAALNYIEDNYADSELNTRVITQTVIWALLGAVDVDSIVVGNPVGLSEAEIKAVEAVMANPNYEGSGKIVDVVYMICEDKDHDFTYCQPQLVPVYADGEHVFKNTLKTTGKIEFDVDPSATLTITKKTILQKLQLEFTPFKELTQYISQSYSSVTATNSEYKKDLTFDSKNNPKGI
ncbi:MAG: hypothetical protein FWH37_09785, partial [Candidatus Bathyarchaeota archaeon]|nr:hypothetical protein [Candidatus Termiticorpusculum sp.]